VPGLVAGVVVGSVAGGGFDKWSDLDVLVVADALPGGFPERWDLVGPRPPRAGPIGWTSAEPAPARRRRNPIAVRAGGVTGGALPPQDDSEVR
jgi:hypothetical protein